MATSPSITPFFTGPYSFSTPIPTTAPMYARTTYLPPPPFGFGAPPYAPYNHPFPYFPTPIPSPYPYPPPAAAYAPPPGFYPTPAPVPVYAPTPADGTYSQIQVPESIAPATLGPQTTGTPASSATPASVLLRRPDQILGTPLPTNLGRPNPRLLDARPPAPNRERCTSRSNASFTSPDPTTSAPTSTSTTALGRPSLDCLHANDSDHIPEVTSAAASASVVFGTPASTTTTTPTPVFACAPAAEGLLFNLVDNKAAFHTNASSDDDDRKTDAVQRHATYRTTSVVFTPASRSTTKVASAPSMFSNTSAAASYLSSPFGPCLVVPAPILASVSATSEATRASIVPSVTAAVASKVFGEMPQQYDFHNLSRKTVFRADGTEHRYYALPDDYALKLATPLVSPSEAENVGAKAAQWSVALERATPEPVFDIYDDDTEGFSSNSVDVFAGTLGQQTHEEDQQKHEDQQPICCLAKLNGGESLSLAKQDKEQLLKCFSKISACRDVPDVYERRTCQKESQGDDKLCWEKSICRTATELPISYFPWDPGASTSLYSSKAELLGNQVETHVQQLRNTCWNVLVTSEKREEWRPGEHTVGAQHRNEVFVKCNSGLSIVLQSMGYQVEGLNPLSLTTPWDPGILIIGDMMLGNTTSHMLCLGFQLQQINNWTSQISNVITSYAYTMDFVNDQWAFLHQNDVQKNYNAKSLISPKNYLQLSEMDIIFTTFLPP